MPGPTSRLEAFSDGVFAIAITLLILEIKVPPPGAAGELGPALARLWPSYLALVTSFANVGVMWINHHRLFALIERTDEGLLGLNLLLLLGVTLVPFPTALLAEHLRGPDQRVAGVVYAGTFLVLALIFNLLWRHARRGGLVVRHVHVDSITRQYAVGPLLYAATLGIAVVSGTACLVVNGVIAIYFALPPRLWQR